MVGENLPAYIHQVRNHTDYMQCIENRDLQHSVQRKPNTRKEPLINPMASPSTYKRTTYGQQAK